MSAAAGSLSRRAFRSRVAPDHTVSPDGEPASSSKTAPTTSAARFGLEVYGYDCRISYAYPGGMSLGEINEPAG